jgi:diguanylate cyclase (GGDEF)-like protein/putative nucleotidyltransferase with HDIG domain
MKRTAQFKLHLMEPSKLYLIGLCVVGFMSFILNTRLTTLTTSEWVMLYSLVGSVLLLNQVKFKMPPEGTTQSMDSALYLACIFTFGLELTLNVLVVSSIIYAIFHRELRWWYHLMNFSTYSLMVTGAHFIFIMTGGSTGQFDTNNIFSYLLALFVYCLINISSVGFYYLISLKKTLFHLIQGILKEISGAYICTMLFSIILSMLLQINYYFGLFLFLIIAILLSMSFKQLFMLYREVSEKAIRDQRTGLYNHGYFEELLIKELAATKTSDSTFSLAILDLDNFKNYNDTYGHLSGDKLLEFFGKLLQTECKSHSYSVARHGGEEFTILMPGKHEKEAFTFINQLRKKANDSYFDGVEIFPHGCLSFSAGIIEYNKGIYDKSQLLDKADQAMYYAKAQGKNLVHIYNEQSLIQKTIDIEKDIIEIEQQLKIFLSKDIYTFQHSKRVFSYAMEICDYISLSDSEKKALILGSLFHDIGKLEVPKHILKKKESLTSEEWEIVKKHVVWGKDIVSAIDKYKELIPLVELHHERVDGKGYPHGLQGEEIPKLARILCIIDSFDAMTTERPYQPTKTFDQAIEELRNCSGEQFDAAFVEPFITMITNKYDFKLGFLDKPDEVS